MANKSVKRISVERSNQVINGVGGNSVVMKTCGVTSQSVSHWRRFGIPYPRFAQIFCSFKRIDVVKDAAQETSR